MLVCRVGRDKDREGTHQDGHAEARTNIQAAGKPCCFLHPCSAKKKSSHVKFLSIPCRGEVGVDLNGLVQDRHGHTRFRQRLDAKIFGKTLL
jgi:hypothetical protein